MLSVLMPDQRPAFAANYNRSSFTFGHGLEGLDIFDAPELAAMSGRLPRSGLLLDCRRGRDRRRLEAHRRPPSFAGRTLESLTETNSLVSSSIVRRTPNTAGSFVR